MISVLAFNSITPASLDSNGIVSHIPRREVASRVLASVGYSKQLHALEIEFRNGAIYRYLNVPPQVYDKLMAAPSKGGYYDANIRRHFHSVHVKPRH
jgi:KTSC domain-containing protein